MDQKDASTEQPAPIQEPLTKDEFLTLWSIDYLEYSTPKEVSSAMKIDFELCSLIFMKLEDFGLITFDIKDKQICNAKATEQAKPVLQDEQYYDYVPE